MPKGGPAPTENHTPRPAPTQEGRPTSESAGTSLPHCSVSCWALLVLLSRWSHAGKRHGGFEDPRHRQSCKELLDCFLELVLKDSGGLTVHICVVGEWHVTWPRPENIEIPTVQLAFACDGFVNVGSFMADLLRFPSGRSDWWHHTKTQGCWGAGVDRTPLGGFLGSLAGSVPMLPLLRQVVWHLGFALQSVLSRATMPNEKRVSGAEITQHDFVEALGNAALLDRMLVQYTESAKKKALELHTTSFSVSTDKASVGGLGGGLMASVIGLGHSGYAVLGVPQATPKGPNTPDTHRALRRHAKSPAPGRRDPPGMYCVMGWAPVSGAFLATVSHFECCSGLWAPPLSPIPQRGRSDIPDRCRRIGPPGDAGSRRRGG